jgi:putative transposase
MIQPNMAEKSWTKKDIRALSTSINTLKDMFKDVLEEALKAELDTQLDYARYDQNKTTKNSRNGYGKKTVHTEYGDVEIRVPRDRLGEFNPVVVSSDGTA